MRWKHRRNKIVVRQNRCNTQQNLESRLLNLEVREIEALSKCFDTTDTAGEELTRGRRTRLALEDTDMAGDELTGGR